MRLLRHLYVPIATSNSQFLSADRGRTSRAPQPEPPDSRGKRLRIFQARTVLLTFQAWPSCSSHPMFARNPRSILQLVEVSLISPSDLEVMLRAASRVPRGQGREVDMTD